MGRTWVGLEGVAGGEAVGQGQVLAHLPQLPGDGQPHAAVVDGGGKGHVGVLLHRQLGLRQPLTVPACVVSSRC